MSKDFKPYIYLSLRPSTKEIGKHIVIGVSKFISGPFYRFEEADQNPDAHELFAKQIKAAKFKYLSNLRCEFVHPEDKKVYFDENGDFRFNNKLLQRVQPGDEDFTLVGQNKVCKDNRQIASKKAAVQIAINSRGKQVLKQKCVPANMPLYLAGNEKKKRIKRVFKRSVFDEQQEFLNLHQNINPNHLVILEPTRNGPRVAKMKLTEVDHRVRGQSEKGKDPAGNQLDGRTDANNNNQSPELPSINQLYECYVKLKKAGLTKFDPIREDPIEWLNKFERLVSNRSHESDDELRFTILPYFLEPTPLDYLKHMRAKADRLDYRAFREQFILTFSCYKSQKIQEAFTYQYQDGDLVDYAKKKFELIDNVFPELSDFDKIRSVIAGMHRKHLIHHFSLNMARDRDEFIIKVTELALGIPH